jgi:hypothetical protein
MKLRIASLTLLWLLLAAIPASAQAVYSNGPINGTVYAWTINYGYVVSDSFTLTCCGNYVTGFDFGAWEFQWDTLSSVDWSITSAENGGTVYGSGTASGTNLTDQFLFVSQYDGVYYNIDKITVTGLHVYMSYGTYWLNLQNAATVYCCDPVYWDENSGPSSASENTLGTIPSESFRHQRHL